MDILPLELRSKALKYRRWEDRYSNLFGKLLLLYGLRDYGGDQDSLKNLRYNQYNKPSLDNSVYFNLSHSGKVVICAFSEEIEIGIDIEERKPIDIWEFDNTFTKEELDLMQNSPDPVFMFYKYWTIKESVIKAIGHGLALPLREVVVSGFNNCRFRDRNFHITSLDPVPGYFCSLAAPESSDVKIQKLDLTDFDRLQPD